MSERRLVICADDYGLSPAVSGAIRDLLAHRRINATSVMVLPPSFDRNAATELRDTAAAARASIGLHVTLTAPFVPLSSAYAPLRQGAFLPLAATAGRALMRSLVPELLSAEISRQFSAFAEAFGRPPDFVDGHQHIHLFPQIREALLGAVKTAAPGAWVRQCGRPVRQRSLSEPKAFLLDWFSTQFRKVAERYGARTNPAFSGSYSLRPSADFAALFPGFLDGMPSGGVVVCHPGRVDAELRRLDPVTDVREHEYEFFRSDTFARLLQNRGYTLA